MLSVCAKLPFAAVSDNIGVAGRWWLQAVPSPPFLLAVRDARVWYVSPWRFAKATRLHEQDFASRRATAETEQTSASQVKWLLTTV